MDGRLVVGRVRGVHGLRGAVRVEVLTDNEERFQPERVLFPEGTDRPLTILSAQRDGPGLLVRFREITTREAADGLRENYLEAAIDQPLPDATYYWHDIVGCAVSTAAGQDLGTVAEIFRVGESEVYVVRGSQGEVLVPAVQAVVKLLDPGAKRIVVDEVALGLSSADAES